MMSNPGHFETGEHIKDCRKFQPGNIDPRTNHRKRNILRQKIKKKCQTMVLFKNLVLKRAEKKKKKIIAITDLAFRQKSVYR